MYVSLYVILSCTPACVCVDVMAICLDHDLNRCSGWWYVFSVNVK